MKANLKNALMIVAALLVVYVGAFFVMMKLETGCRSYLLTPSTPGYRYSSYERAHVPRWVTLRFPSNSERWLDTLFAPLIWVEHQVRPPEYWEWKRGQPKPDWMKPSTP